MMNLPKDDYIVSEVYLSKADKDGESDITVIIESSGIKYGLLIEDKIDAIAMPEQLPVNTIASLRLRKGFSAILTSYS